MSEVFVRSSSVELALRGRRVWPVALLLSAVYLPVLAIPWDFGDPILTSATTFGRTLGDRWTAVLRSEPQALVPTAFAEVMACLVGDASVGWRLFQGAMIVATAGGLLLLLQGFGFSAGSCVAAGMVALGGPWAVTEFRMVLSPAVWGVGFAAWASVAARKACQAEPGHRGKWDLLGIMAMGLAIFSGSAWAIASWAIARWGRGNAAFGALTAVWGCAGGLPGSYLLPTQVAGGFLVAAGLARWGERLAPRFPRVAYMGAMLAGLAWVLPQVASLERYAAQQRKWWLTFEQVSAQIVGPTIVAWSLEDGLSTADALRFQRMLQQRHAGSVQFGLIDREGKPISQDGIPALTGEPTWGIVGSHWGADPSGRWSIERSIQIAYWGGCAAEQCQLVRYHPEAEAQAAWLRQQIEQQLTQEWSHLGEELAEPRK